MPPRKIEHYPVTIEGEVAAPVVEEMVETIADLPAGPWRDLSDAPKDGTMIEFNSGDHVRWRITRQRQDRRWKEVGFWAEVQTLTPIWPEASTKWKMPDGYLYPGMVL